MDLDASYQCFYPKISVYSVPEGYQGSHLHLQQVQVSVVAFFT
jgi:hypothetical protein